MLSMAFFSLFSIDLIYMKIMFITDLLNEQSVCVVKWGTIFEWR